jgi:NAD(P)-dependent dehydrogenase (short-subunit alcohol dehydrogenase family)
MSWASLALKTFSYGRHMSNPRTYSDSSVHDAAIMHDGEQSPRRRREKLAGSAPKGTVQDTNQSNTYRQLDSTLKSVSHTTTQQIPKTNNSLIQSFTKEIKVAYELSFLVTVYVLNPFQFIEIWLPFLVPFLTMGIFSTPNPFKPSTSIPSLANKVILVTGGNSGLGKEAIQQLAQHGGPAKIYMGARSADKATAAINSIRNNLTNPTTEIVHLPLDLNSLTSVRQAAEQVKAKESRLDILMLNAGIMATPLAKTEQGFEQQVGVNHIGHFYLTQQLLPLLTATAKLSNADVRVVSLTSEAYNLGPSSVAQIANNPSLLKQSAWSRYGASKAANILFTAELARRYPQLTTASVHPGIIMTDLHTAGQESYSFVGWFMKLAAPIIATDVPKGTWNQLWAATAKKAEVQSGSYYTPVGKRQGNLKWANDKDAGSRLWNWSEEEIKKVGF